MRAILKLEASFRAALLAALAAAPVLAAAPPTPEAQLATMRAEVQQAKPSPEQLGKIPRALALAETFSAAGKVADAGAALNVATIYALLGGDERRAVTLANRAAARCMTARDRLCFGRAMNQAAIGLWRLDDPYGAMRRLGWAARAFRDAGDPGRAAIARLNAANIRHDIGDRIGALADYEAIDRSCGDDADWDPLGLLVSKAEALLKLGRLDEARATALRALARLDRMEPGQSRQWETDPRNATRTILALVEARRGDPKAAIPLFRESIAFSDRSGSPLERYNANHSFAEGLVALGRAPEAAPFIATALRLTDATDPAGRRESYDLASRIAAAAGRPVEALAYVRASERIRSELAAAHLRSAIGDSIAQTALADREAQLARRDAQAIAQRSRLLVWTGLAILLVVALAVGLLIRMRAKDIERRYAAVLDERTRMARELHDTLLQGFTGITLQLHAAAKTDPARIGAALTDAADEAARWLGQARQAVWDMRPAPAQSDLRQGLEQAVATARLQSEIDIALDCTLDVAPDQTATTALLRVAQEALSNAARHARASRIEVAVRAIRKRATLTVRDDGVGFRAAPGLSALGGHWGLLGMRERMEALGGTLVIDAAPGRGSIVTAELPL